MHKFTFLFSGCLLLSVSATFHLVETENNTAAFANGLLYTSIMDTVPTKKPPVKGASASQTITKDIEKGKALVQKSDCFACHRETEKLVGPSYAEVAKKYKPTQQNIALLANKVIAGGKGAWGEIPMTPHPMVPLADAKEMIKYVLSVKSK